MDDSPVCFGIPSRPTVADAATRLLILKYRYMYARSLPPADLLAEWAQAHSAAECLELERGFGGIRASVCAALQESGLWSAMEPGEIDFMSRPLFAVTVRDAINISWSSEAAAGLAWALELRPDIGPYDGETDPAWLGELATGAVREFIGGATLRADAEVEHARRIAELWHWRARTRDLELEGFVPPADLGVSSLDEVVRTTAAAAHDAGQIGAPVAGDFPVLGKAYRDATDEERSRLRSIALERHKALNWLCGYAPDNRWEQTPTET